MRSLNENWINNLAVKSGFGCLEFKTCRNVNLVYGRSMSLMGGRGHSSSVPSLYLPNYTIFTRPCLGQRPKYGPNGFNGWNRQMTLILYSNILKNYVMLYSNHSFKYNAIIILTLIFVSNFPFSVAWKPTRQVSSQLEEPLWCVIFHRIVFFFFFRNFRGLDLSVFCISMLSMKVNFIIKF